MLRIAGVSENPRGVKIRYKLVQSGEAKPAKPTPIKSTQRNETTELPGDVFYTDQLMVHAWDIGYNLTTNISSVADRWKLVEHSIVLLRDEGLQKSPDSLGIHRELAWFFLHRLGLYLWGYSVFFVATTENKVRAFRWQNK